MSTITVHSPFDDKNLMVDRVSSDATMGSSARTIIQLTYGHGREQKIIALSVDDARTLSTRLTDLTQVDGKS